MLSVRNRVAEILEEHGMEYYNHSGCFDIVARGKRIMLLKTLANIDSFQEFQACNLKIMTKSLEASSFLVGVRTRREKLKDNIVYERFEIPAVTPDTLDSILKEDLPKKYRFRGGLFAEISPEKLRMQREEAGLSQAGLAKKVGVTKKSIYIYENRKIKISSQTVARLEELLGKISVPIDMSPDFSEVENKPCSRFESSVFRDLSKLGLQGKFVYQAPFNIVARGTEFTLLSDADERQERIEKKMPDMINFSDITKKPVLIVTREEVEFELPSIKEGDLKALESPRELKKLLKTW